MRVDVQGMSGSKVEIEDIPYRSIVPSRIVAAGTLDIDAERGIRVSSTAAPMSLQLGHAAGSVAINRARPEKTFAH